MAMQRAQLPYLANFYKDISRTKQRELLEAEKIKQGLPKQIQERISTDLMLDLLHRLDAICRSTGCCY